MLVKYTLKFSSRNLWDESGTPAWTSPEGTKIRQQIDELIEQFGLTRESPHRSPETLDLTAQRYPYNPNDYVMFEKKVYRVIGMQNLGTGVKIANYPGVANKVVNVNKVQPIKRRSGFCARA